MIPPVPQVVGPATVAAELLGDTAAPEVTVAAAVIAVTFAFLYNRFLLARLFAPVP